MKYNDNSLTEDKDFNLINNYYQISIQEEQDDLQHILDKMVEQKNFLNTHNKQGIYNSALNKLNSSIQDLSSIIHNTKTQQSNINPDIAISPTRSNHEINQTIQPLSPSDNISNTISPDLELDNTLRNNISTDTPQSNPQTNTRKNSQRNITPRQSNIVSNLIKSLNLNIFNKRAPSTNIDYNLSRHRNRFHNMHIAEELISPHIIYNEIKYNMYNTYNKPCPYEKKLVHNQIDIIRLLLLFIATRPHCRYCSRISHLAHSQCDILLELDY